MSRETYVNPLTTRYAGATMSRVWSDSMKFQTWRKLWIALVRVHRGGCLRGPVCRTCATGAHPRARRLKRSGSLAWRK